MERHEPLRPCRPSPPAASGSRRDAALQLRTRSRAPLELRWAATAASLRGHLLRALVGARAQRHIRVLAFASRVTSGSEALTSVRTHHQLSSVTTNTFAFVPPVRAPPGHRPPTGAAARTFAEALFHRSHQAVVCKDVIVQCTCYTVYHICHICGVHNTHTLSQNLEEKDFIQSFAFDMSDGAEADSDKHFTAQRL